MRKLARRLMEVQLLGIAATLRALNGEVLCRPGISHEPRPVIAIAPKLTPSLSELTRHYGDERVARKSWSERTEFQVRGYLDLLVNLLGDPAIGDITKEDMRRLGLDLTKLPSNLTKKYPGKTPREALEA